MTFVYTRTAPPDWPVRAGRLTAETLAASVLPPGVSPTIFLGGATAFVETASNWLVASGHDPDHIRTERYGGIGGAP